MEDLTVVKTLNCSGAFGEHFEKKVKMLFTSIGLVPLYRERQNQLTGQI